MKEDTILLLKCPDCGKGGLACETYEFSSGTINEGRLTCSCCKKWFRIENGIADILPLRLRSVSCYREFAKKHGLDVDFSDYAPEAAGEDDRVRQMHFFGENHREYEEKIVNSKYYRALDEVVFVDWMRRNLKKQSYVLDVGCGTARQCILLAQKGMKVVGVDISEEMLILAKNKCDSLGLSRQVDFIMGDAQDLPLKNNIFDACILFGALHHLSDKQTAIDCASSKLRRGGLYFSLDPNDSPVRFIFDFLMKIWKLYGEEASDHPLLSERQLTQWLENSGIKTCIRYSTYLPPHVFYLLTHKINLVLLGSSDFIFRKIPGMKSMAGAIVAQGIKQ